MRTVGRGGFFAGYPRARTEPDTDCHSQGERVMKTSITHVAMDTHKKQHQVTWVHPDTGEIQEFTVASTAREIERIVKKSRKQTSVRLMSATRRGSVVLCCSGYSRGSAVSAGSSRRHWCRSSRGIGSRQADPACAIGTQQDPRTKTMQHCNNPKGRNRHPIQKPFSLTFADDIHLSSGFGRSYMTGRYRT